MRVYADCNVYPHGYAIADTYLHDYTIADTDTDPHCHGHTLCHADGNADVDSHLDANAKRYVRQHSNAHDLHTLPPANLAMMEWWRRRNSSREFTEERCIQNE